MTAWRWISPEEADYQAATNAYVEDTWDVPGALMPHEVLQIEEMFGVTFPEYDFDQEWRPGKPPVVAR